MKTVDINIRKILKKKKKTQNVNKLIIELIVLK